MKKFYKLTERLMWSTVVFAFVAFPFLAANYSMI